MTSFRSLAWGASVIALVAAPVVHADAPHHRPTPSSSPFPSSPSPPPVVTDFAAGNGAMSVPRPVGRDWNCAENRGMNETRLVVMVNCRRETPEFYFSARDTTVTAGPVPTAESLWQAGGTYRRDIDRSFHDVQYLANHVWTFRGHTGWEIVFDGGRNRGGSARHVERTLVVGTHIFLWIAEAAPDQFEAMRREIDRWFDGVRFAALP